MKLLTIAKTKKLNTRQSSQECHRNEIKIVRRKKGIFIPRSTGRETKDPIQC